MTSEHHDLSDNEVDAFILANVTDKWSKVARIIGCAIVGEPYLSTIFDRLISRIEALIQEGKLESTGNVRKPRFSEVRFPKGSAVTFNQQDYQAVMKKLGPFAEIRTLKNIGKYQEAINICNALIEADEACFHAYTERSYALYQLGKHDEALRDTDIQIKLLPNSPGLYFSRGEWNLELGRYESAIKDFTFVFGADEEYRSYAYFLRSIAYWKLGNQQQAFDDCEQLPADFSYYSTLLYEKGQICTKDDLHNLFLKQH